MKARKFTKRDRTTVGRATGTLLCRLSLPAINQKYDWRAEPVNPAKAVGLIRKFVNRQLSRNLEFHTGAKFVIEAEIRASRSRIGRKLLARWNFGDDLALTFEQVSKAWESLKFEEEYSSFEIELEL